MWLSRTRLTSPLARPLEVKIASGIVSLSQPRSSKRFMIRMRAEMEHSVGLLKARTIVFFWPFSPFFCHLQVSRAVWTSLGLVRAALTDMRRLLVPRNSTSFHRKALGSSAGVITIPESSCAHSVRRMPV